ncbi:hypothetical protein AVEN_250262-1, partial [Araneus ventricosus]
HLYELFTVNSAKGV